MVVYRYDHDIVLFSCEKCNIDGACDIGDLLTDNCAIAINIECEKCGDSRKIRILKCNDIHQAKDLNKKFISL